MGEYKETSVIDESGRVLSVEFEGVSMPADCSFRAVNDWVHDTGRHYEELQWHALGAANEYDKLKAGFRVARHLCNTGKRQAVTTKQLHPK